MKILALTDIHGHYENFKELKSIIKDKEIDCIIICGDITNFGSKEDAHKILSFVKEFKVPIFVIPGNCDQKSVLEKLDELKVNLHEKKVNFQNYRLYGFGGSNVTPFNTPFETKDAKIYEKLVKFIKKGKNSIFVFHAPPYDTKLDFIGNSHVGSKSIRRIIEEYKPKLVLCGHVHEARGKDEIGKSIIINPGVFSYKEAAIVYDEKEVQFINF